MTWNNIANVDVATSSINLTHQQKIDQTELGTKTPKKLKWGIKNCIKVYFLKHFFVL
jgi:hypothetical protein